MGKITIKHYLNKRVKPEYNDSTNNEYYPINYSITVNRKTTYRQSRIFNTYSNELFNNDIELKEAIKKETDLLNRIIDIYLFDFEKKQLRNEYEIFSNKNYNSTDEMLNQINIYIDYYTKCVFSIVCDYVDREIEAHLRTKIQKQFDLSMLSDYEKDIISINVNNLIGSTEAEFVYKNTNEQIIKLYILKNLMKSGLGAYSIRFVYDYPLIDMQNEAIINFIREIAPQRIKNYFIQNGFVITREILMEYENTLKYLTSFGYLKNNYRKL